MQRTLSRSWVRSAVGRMRVWAARVAATLLVQSVQLSQPIAGVPIARAHPHTSQSAKPENATKQVSKPLTTQGEPSSNASLDHSTAARAQAPSTRGHTTRQSARPRLLQPEVRQVDWASPPRFGGVTVLTPSYAAEVVVQSRGKIKAWVTDRARAVIPPGALRVTVGVSSASGMQFVPLRWDSTHRMFIGYMPASAAPVPGPLELRVEHGAEQAAQAKQDTRHEHGVATVASPLPPPTKGGFVIAAGPHAVEVVPYENGARNGVRGSVVEVYPATEWTVQRVDRITTLVSLADAQREPLLVTTRWSASAGCWRATLPRNVHVGSGPMDVVVREQTLAHRGGFASTRPMPAARHRGTRVLAGPYAVEFVLQPSGAVQAWVYDEHGLTPSWSTTQLSMNAHDIDGNVYAMPLNWQLSQARYEGTSPLLARSIAWVDVKIRKNLNTAYAPDVYWPGAVQWLGEKAKRPRSLDNAQPASVSSTPLPPKPMGSAGPTGTSSMQGGRVPVERPSERTQARPSDNTLPPTNTTRPPDVGSTGWWY